METKTSFIVRYAETDQMGIVHHSNYAIWYEAGRTNFLKDVGISYSSIEEKGVLLPLYELNCKFISPAKYEDEIIVITNLKSLSRVRIIFSYQVIDAINNKLIATGETMHAWTDKTLKPVNAEKIIPEVYAILNKKTKQ
jgi:acyl-CoA thioester hydrolase